VYMYMYTLSIVRYVCLLYQKYVHKCVYMAMYEYIRICMCICAWIYICKYAHIKQNSGYKRLALLEENLSVQSVYQIISTQNDVDGNEEQHISCIDSLCKYIHVCIYIHTLNDLVGSSRVTGRTVLVESPSAEVNSIFVEARLPLMSYAQMCACECIS